MVGFWCPAFVGSNLNVPGFHFHFLSADKQRGGHVLQLEMQQGAAAYLQEVSEPAVLHAVHVALSMDVVHAVHSSCRCCKEQQ